MATLRIEIQKERKKENKMYRIPCPIPYQGSKRGLAFKILSYAPPHISGRLIEPFAGSAAISLAAAMTNKASQFIIADCLKPLMEIWKLILENPEQLAAEYEQLWYSQLDDPKNTYFRIRDEFNTSHHPVKLLYLIVRCAKNAVRFNSEGQFNQSPDNRRLGMRPEKMRQEIFNAHRLLSGRTITLAADYREVLRLAEPDDLVYMDPPYQGVSSIGNPRYAQQLDLDAFIKELQLLNERNIQYLVSFDGACGRRTYGQELPGHLRLKRILLPAGRSSQATLLGRKELTVESLYLSPALVEKIIVGDEHSLEQLSMSDLQP